MAWFGFLLVQLVFSAIAWVLTHSALLGVGFALLGAWLWWFAVLWQNARFYRWAKNEGVESNRFIGYWSNLQYFWRRQQRKHQFREERMLRNLQELRLAIQASPNGVMLLDQHWSIEWFNTMACEHLGLDGDRDTGQNLLALVRDPEFASYCAVGDFRETLTIDGRSPIPGTAVGRRRISIQLFRYGDDKLLLLSRDVTHVHQNETMRRDFIANVSHEVRTPLTIFSGYVETLQTLPLKDEDRARYYSRMQHQAARMQVLISDLLTLSALEGSPLPHLKDFVDIYALLLCCRDEAIGLSGSLAQEGDAPAHAISLLYQDEQGGTHNLSSRSPATQSTAAGLENVEEMAQAASAAALGPHLDESLTMELVENAPAEARVEAAARSMGRLAGSEKEIHSAFFNLVANAVRYTPPGGSINISWRWNGDGSASFAVADTGPGIAAEHLPRLSERFYRVDRSRSRETGGTGLGLAIVKHVAERHGGYLRIESEVGKGSEFRIELPAARLQTAKVIEQEEMERDRRRRMLAS